MVCHKPGRNCSPVSLGSRFRASATSVMDPVSGFSNQVKMQVKVKQGQRGFILLHRLLDKIFTRGLIFEEDFHRLDPRLVDFSFTHFLVSVSQMKADETQ